MTALPFAIFALLLALAAARLNRWRRWESRNSAEATMLFGARTERQRLIKRLTSEPPDRHGDLWQ